MAFVCVFASSSNGSSSGSSGGSCFLPANAVTVFAAFGAFAGELDSDRAALGAFGGGPPSVFAAFGARSTGPGFGFPAGGLPGFDGDDLPRSEGGADALPDGFGDFAPFDPRPDIDAPQNGHSETSSSSTD